MKKLVFNYELGKWSSVGVTSRPSLFSVSPISGSVKRTLDAFSIGDYAYGIVDVNFKPTFISDSILKVMGVEPENFGMDVILGHIPEREKETVNNYHYGVLQYFEKKGLPDDELLKIRFDYSYRHPSRGFRRILQQVAPFEIGSDGISSFLVVFIDISYLKRSGKNDYAVINMRSGAEEGKGVGDILQNSIPNPFSKRELDVLRCLKSGMRTEEIAEKFFLSKNTVYNHKKRMFKKTGTSSTVDLLIATIQNGWVK